MKHQPLGHKMHRWQHAQKEGRDYDAPIFFMWLMTPK